jgi:hypothetical protein
LETLTLQRTDTATVTGATFTIDPVHSVQVEEGPIGDR